MVFLDLCLSERTQGVTRSHDLVPTPTPLASLLHAVSLPKCASASEAVEQIQMVESTAPRRGQQLLKDIIALEGALFVISE